MLIRCWRLPINHAFVVTASPCGFQVILDTPKPPIRDGGFPLSRLWCLYEIAETNKREKQLELITCGFNGRELSHLFQKASQVEVSLHSLLSNAQHTLSNSMHMSRALYSAQSMMT